MRFQQISKYLQLIDWLALSTSALVLVIGLWSASVAFPEYRKNQHAYESKHESTAVSESPNDERLANYTLWLMIFTGLLAGSTILLWLAADDQAKLTRESIDLARDEFIAAHRPEFAIHSINLMPFRNELPPDQQPIRASFVIINTGTSAGTILSSATYLECSYPIDAPWRGRPPHNRIITATRYTAGAADTIHIEGDYLSGLNYVNHIIGDTPGNPKMLYLYGWIMYDDDRGGRRTTYFCRRYDPSIERFIAIEDPEANQTY